MSVKKHTHTLNSDCESKLYLLLFSFVLMLYYSSFLSCIYRFIICQGSFEKNPRSLSWWGFCHTNRFMETVLSFVFFFAWSLLLTNLACSNRDGEHWPSVKWLS